RAAESWGAYPVPRPEHWAFEGTGLVAGRKFGGADSIVAYECDGCAFETGPDGLPVPTGVDGAGPGGLEVLATGPAHLWAPGGARGPRAPRDRPRPSVGTARAADALRARARRPRAVLERRLRRHEPGAPRRARGRPRGDGGVRTPRGRHGRERRRHRLGVGSARPRGRTDHA